MARDPQAALVALNRFGFGARGAASGDYEAAIADPRGFVKAELLKPNAALLIAPGLLSTPELGQALFAYQKEVRLQREQQKAAQPQAQTVPNANAAVPVPSAPAAAPQRSLSGPKPDQMAAASGDGMSAQPPVPAPTAPAQPQTQVQPQPPLQQPPQPLNVIQKTFRTEALARFQHATLAEVGFVERLVAFWSNHFCISANKGEPA